MWKLLHKESLGIINLISSEFFKVTCFGFICKLFKMLYVIHVACLELPICFWKKHIFATGRIGMNGFVFYLLSDDQFAF